MEINVQPQSHQIVLPVLVDVKALATTSIQQLPMVRNKTKRLNGRIRTRSDDAEEADEEDVECGEGRK